MKSTISKTIQLDQILQTVAGYTHSQSAAEKLRQRPRLTELTAVKQQLALTAEAHQLLAQDVMLTFFDVDQLDDIQKKLAAGWLLTAPQLATVGALLTSADRLLTVLQQHADCAPELAAKATKVGTLKGLQRSLTTALVNGQVADTASPELAKLRPQIRQQRQQLQSVVSQFAQKNASALQSQRLITRDEHVCVQLKANYKHRFAGAVIDRSATGSTVFFEPQAAIRCATKLTDLIADEQAQIYQILATLTGDIQSHWSKIEQQRQLIRELDQVMACGRYGLELDSRVPHLNTEQHIKIVSGRHPLLGTETVPLNLELAPYQGLMITGANSGGKTIVLKTIALFALMVQVGLEIPVAAGTDIPIFSQFWIDIGDNQSIDDQLSTFAAEMTTLVEITQQIQPNALVLLDEIGSGTDPEEGSALSAAIIDYLRSQDATVIATTHFSAIKQYAVDCEQFVTATMAFDPQTLRPTYRLLLNRVGNSEAIWLAERLGLADSILQAARQRLDQVQ